MRKPRMRRAYLKPLMAPPKNSGLNKEGMAALYNNIPTQGHSLAFSELAGVFALENERQFNKIRHLMETRARMLAENLHHNRHMKERWIHVVLQQSKHFSLVLFWNTGAGRYYFIKKQFDLIRLSKPYVSRASAMDAHTHKDIFWLDFIRLIPTV